MPRTQKLLLVENVESLGIVGDIVNVRNGYARNFLLPRALATKPSDELIQQLQGKRAEAQKMLAEQRRLREGLAQKLQGVEIKLIRSCNDQGILYAAITQQDVANELNAGGYAVKPRDVRINQVMKRIDSYEVHIKLDSDLDSSVKVHVQADRKLDLHHRDEHAAPAAASEHATNEAPAADGESKGEKKSKKGDKAPKGDAAPEAKAEKADKGGENKFGGKAEKKAEAKAEKADKGEKKSKKA
ncbi:MAG: 50S ribosomal protein L9 [Phycisphaerales bacterium]|nr:50S ribosomal protein L9 [Phycisphaerales bacterium]